MQSKYLGIIIVGQLQNKLPGLSTELPLACTQSMLLIVLKEGIIIVPTTSTDLVKFDRG